MQVNSNQKPVSDLLPGFQMNGDGENYRVPYNNIDAAFEGLT